MTIRRPTRTKFLPTPKASRKKKQKAVEIVECCDQCGKKLEVSRARNIGSMVCAAGCRVPLQHIVEADKHEFFYFCSNECLNAHSVGK